MTSVLAQSAKQHPCPRYAVVMKTYGWDPFIARQAQRCAACVESGDFFISADETRGPLPEIPYPTVHLDQAGMTAWGLADRAEKGAFFWWNADYPHYHFQACFPEYDFYVFVEYDALYLGSYDELVSALADESVDFAAFPLPESKETWPWTQRHLGTYTWEELEGCLMCISVYSRQALQQLFSRRLAMSLQPDITYWPSAEVFLPTEVKKARLRATSLAAYADSSRFNWQPPQLEADVLGNSAPLFAHPVYDRARYVRRALAQAETLGPLLKRTGPVRQTLSSLPVRAYLAAYLARVGAMLVASFSRKVRSVFEKVSLVQIDAP